MHAMFEKLCYTIFHTKMESCNQTRMTSFEHVLHQVYKILHRIINLMSTWGLNFRIIVQIMICYIDRVFVYVLG